MAAYGSNRVTTPIREQNGVREAVDAAWGLVPFWWSKPLNEKAFYTFNAKVERVKEAKSYRHAIDTQRCLVPAGTDKLTRRPGLALLDRDLSALYVDASAHSERVLRSKDARRSHISEQK